jgi:hypothetical protein
MQTVPVNAKIISFKHQLFEKIKQELLVKDEEIISSLSPEYNFEEIFKSNQKARQAISTNEGGKSGSFFFFSHDKKFIIKTITESELKLLMRLLNSFLGHFKKQKEKGEPTFICKIVGVFQLQIKTMPTAIVMVMKNAISRQSSESKISHIFDLKGSKLSRNSLNPEHLNLRKNKLYRVCSGMTLKDLDLMHI